MKQIAVAIMVVGLCFYQVYSYKEKDKQTDLAASLIAFIGAVWLLLS